MMCIALARLAVLLLATTPIVRAQLATAPDSSLYFTAPLAELTLTEGTLPGWESQRWSLSDRPHPYAVLDGPGESCVAREPFSFETDASAIAIRIPERRGVTGRLFVETGGRELVALRFEVAADRFSADARQPYFEQRMRCYDGLLTEGRPGAAWWRHLRDRAAREAGLATESAPGPAAWENRSSASEMEDTYALFTGGRAVAENLQLDRMLPATPPDDEAGSRPVEGIAGISVPEYDWSQSVAGLSPALDPLAALIPADQHALFFPSFQALIDMADQADAQGTPVLQALSDPSGEAGTKARYQRQLGLPLSDIARLLGPAVIDSVALTGGDPYLRTGSDVALLFQAKDADLLHPLITARVAAAMATEAGVESRDGRIDDVAYSARVSVGRELSSYVCRLDETIVVSNSEAQLRRLISVRAGEAPALATLPEYAFFRDRYPLGEPEESALLVVSDATIRRWCGPRWRIGSSRRTRAEAALSEVQARLLDRGANSADASGAATPAGLGTLTITADRPRSSIYGTLGFMTPITELDLSRVSGAEADLYATWRDGYQQNWSGVFDPIAVRFSVAPGRLAGDVTVRPLIAGSDYRELVELARGATIAPHACDPHDDALLHWAMAIDKQSPLLGEQASMLAMLLPEVDALGWLGQSVSLYIDDDPLWDELRAADDAEDFMQRNWPRLPVAVHAEVGNGLLLTAFLVGLRGMAEQSAPEMTLWENHMYRDEPYVTIRPSQRALGDMQEMAGDEDLGFERAALRYVASGDGLLFSLSQPLIERAIDRRLARKAQREAQRNAQAASAEAAPPATTAPSTSPAPAPWLGQHLCARLRGEVFEILDQVFGSQDGADLLREQSYANLPILNAWHELLPGEDPVAAHERLWNRRLLCPGGGSYRWNEEWQTMESSVYGHPGQRRDGPGLPPALATVESAAAGLSFEEDGLRARFELLLKAR
jgi:hypothetical protein